ncbi:MAG TPA: PilZ domain-containing protein [Nitrospiria bacterium]|jgi:hypothetical protein|nr:PilZ domain-containing protein [Nitrospiria bacterium]
MPEKSQELPRASARFSSNLRVEFHRAVGSSTENQKQPGLDGVLQNISSGGACIMTTDPLKVAEVLKISFPVQQIFTPRTLAEVRWTHPLPEGKFAAGLRFLL